MSASIAISLLCLIIAAVLFGIAAFWEPYHQRLISGGLFFFAVSFLAASLKIVQG